ncbi:hypothetical protein KI387_027864 [Taxus chinensis]|uniref:Uncharacterized protein n=1 Tax=Taxus chinensis TaxID=29808 RepID=A0AA38L2P8_TAXCH|nr:hypothetical protein KI387_027864 [Taxus chinensis]
MVKGEQVVAGGQALTGSGRQLTGLVRVCAMWEILSSALMIHQTVSWYTANKSDGRFIQPAGFELIWRNTESGTKDTLSIWIPRAPTGYVAIGCVVVPDYYEPDPCIAYCVREDCVKKVDFEKQPSAERPQRCRPLGM